MISELMTFYKNCDSVMHPVQKKSESQKIRKTKKLDIFLVSYATFSILQEWSRT